MQLALPNYLSTYKMMRSKRAGILCRNVLLSALQKPAHPYGEHLRDLLLWLE